MHPGWPEIRLQKARSVRDASDLAPPANHCNRVR